MSNSITYTQDGNIVLVALPQECVYTLRKGFEDVFKNRGSGVSYRLDFKMTQYVDSGFLGILLLLREHVDGQSDRVEIINASPDVLKMFQTVHFTTLFKVS
jgi:HptB-dependent secretion and biofilm anti anti-sigma factor